MSEALITSSTLDSPAVNKRPASSKPSSSEKKTSNDLIKPAAQPRSNSATTVQNVTVSARKPWHSAPAQREMKKSGPVAKSENSTKSDQPSRNEGSVRQRSDSAEPKVGGLFQTRGVQSPAHDVKFCGPRKGSHMWPSM